MRTRGDRDSGLGCCLVRSVSSWGRYGDWHEESAELSPDGWLRRAGRRGTRLGIRHENRGAQGHLK